MLVTYSQFNRAVVPFNRLLALAFDTLPLFLQFSYYFQK